MTANKCSCTIKAMSRSTRTTWSLGRGKGCVCMCVYMCVCMYVLCMYVCIPGLPLHLSRSWISAYVLRWISDLSDEDTHGYRISWMKAKGKMYKCVIYISSIFLWKIFRFPTMKHERHLHLIKGQPRFFCICILFLLALFLSLRVSIDYSNW